MRDTGGERRHATGASGVPTSDQSYRARAVRPEYVSWFGASQEQQVEQQQQLPRRYYSTGSSPMAVTPSFSTLSPLFPSQTQSQQSSPPSASSTSAATAQRALDEEIGQIFTRYIPTFFDLLEKYQYQKALRALNDDEETEWKGWPVLLVMLKLAASCESTYHLMKYLEPDLVATDTIEQMYGKLVMLMNHLAEELKPLVARQSCHFPMLSRTPTPSGNGNGHGNSQHGHSHKGSMDGQDDAYDPMLLMEIAMCGDMSYYAELLEQGAEFFSLRVPMLQLYRGLARSTVPRDYHGMLKRLESLLMRFDAFDHPLLETLKQSAIEELSTVHAAIQCEVRVAEYDFTRSIVALHRLKVQLRSWSDHIDSVSDYPLFEGDGALGDGDDEGQLLLDESDDNYGTPSDSVYSGASYSNQSSASMARTQPPYTLASSLSTDSLVGGASGIGSATIPGAGAATGAPPPLTGSLVSHRAGRYINMGDTSYDVADETRLLEKEPSGMSLDSASSPVSSETRSTITRLLSQSSLLRRGGLLASALPIRRGLVQKPGDPYVSSVDGASVGPTNTLEQVILGGGGSGAAGGGANNGLGSSQTNVNGGNGAANGGNNNLLAAEMMASSMKKLERDDGFALPVFQWSKRFYRSLVAKFSLYFHHWLDPFEKKSDCLSLELTRFIRTPLGISYLQLMDVLLARGSHRGNEGKTRIMLILETQQLENKGAHYYENGYRCPSSTKARYSRTNQEAQDDQEEQEAKLKAMESSSGTGSRTQSPAASVGSRGAGSSNSPMNDVRRRSMEQQTSHALFMRIDKEQNEEQNDFSELWGLRSWPAIFCYPDSSPPLEHWPNIVSLIMDNRAALDSVHPAFTHVERRMKVTYHITRVDEAMFLVLLVEGGRRPNEKVAQDFMQTVTENLQHSGAFEPRVLSEEAAARVAATNL